MGSAAADAAAPTPTPRPEYARHPQEPLPYTPDSGRGGGVYYERPMESAPDEEDVDPDERSRLRHLSRRRLSAPEAVVGRGSLGASEVDAYPHSSGPHYVHPYGGGRGSRPPQPPGTEPMYHPMGGVDRRALSPLPSLPPPRAVMGSQGGDAYGEAAYAPPGYGLQAPPGGPAEARDRPLPPLLQPPPPGGRYVVPGSGMGAPGAGGRPAAIGGVAFVQHGGGGGGGGGRAYSPGAGGIGAPAPSSSRPNVSDVEADVDRHVVGGRVAYAGGPMGVRGAAVLGRGGRVSGVGDTRGIPSTAAGAAVVAAATAAGRCTVCGMVLSPGASLARHMRLAHGGAATGAGAGSSDGSGGRKFTCGQCTQAFKRRYDLQEHTRQVHLKVCFFFFCQGAAESS